MASPIVVSAAQKAWIQSILDAKLNSGFAAGVSDGLALILQPMTGYNDPALGPIPDPNALTTADNLAIRTTFELVLAAILDEPWHEVSSFQNGWSNLGGNNSTAAYHLSVDRVYLKGQIVGPDAGTVAFQLPVGYRPPKDMKFSGCAIDSDGNVSVPSSTVGILDGVCFRLS